MTKAIKRNYLGYTRMRLLLILLFVIGSVGLFAGVHGNVEFKPEKPSVASGVEVTYSGGKYFEEKDSVYAFVYYFTSNSNMPVVSKSYLMQYKKGKFTTKIASLPQGAVFALVKVGNGVVFDYNIDKMWDFLVYADSKPVRDANLKCAFSYLPNNATTLKRLQDMEKALFFTNAELKLYPNNVQAKTLQHSLNFNLKNLTADAYTENLKSVIDAGFDKNNESDVRAIANAHRDRKNMGEADAIEKEFITKNPTSELADESWQRKLYSQPSTDEFEKALREYMEQFPKSPTTAKMWMDLTQFFLSNGNGDAAIRLVRSYPTPKGTTNSQPPATILNMIAVSFLQQDSLLPLAQQYAERAVRDVEATLLNPENHKIPKWQTEIEYLHQIREMGAIAHDTYGYILRKQNKLDLAIESFKMSEEYLGDAVTQDMLEHQAEALFANGNTDESKKTMERAIKLGKAIPQMIERYKSVSPGEEGAKALKELLAQSKEAKKKKMILEMINVPLKVGSLTTMEGKEVSVPDLKGKVLVVDFWATWCGPCRVSMPYMQKVYEKYRDNKNVEIMMVNVWERVEDRKKNVEDFLKTNNKLTFPMYLDLKDEFVKMFGVTGIPTKFYIDRNGYIQFKEVGFPGADTFVEESSEKIDLLLED